MQGCDKHAAQSIFTEAKLLLGRNRRRRGRSVAQQNVNRISAHDASARLRRLRGDYRVCSGSNGSG
jgi:hypothetical protein